MMIFEHSAPSPGYQALPATAWARRAAQVTGAGDNTAQTRGAALAAPAPSRCSGTLAGGWTHGLSAARVLGERCANKQNQGHAAFLRKFTQGFPFSHTNSSLGRSGAGSGLCSDVGGVHQGSLGQQSQSRQDKSWGSGLQLKSLHAAECWGTFDFAHVPSTPSPQGPSGSHFLPSLLFAVPPPPSNPLMDMARPGMHLKLTHLVTAL